MCMNSTCWFVITSSPPHFAYAFAACLRRIMVLPLGFSAATRPKNPKAKLSISVSRCATYSWRQGALNPKPCPPPPLSRNVIAVSLQRDCGLFKKSKDSVTHLAWNSKAIPNHNIVSATVLLLIISTIHKCWACSPHNQEQRLVWHRHCMLLNINAITTVRNQVKT